MKMTQEEQAESWEENQTRVGRRGSQGGHGQQSTCCWETRWHEVRSVLTDKDWVWPKRFHGPP